MDYDQVLSHVVQVLEAGRHAAARSVNAVMTATYWLIGRRIVEGEQGGRERAAYGKQLVERLAADLSTRFGRGFSRRNLFQIRKFYLAWPIVQMPSAQSARPDILADLAGRFPLPWSHYLRLLAVENPEGRAFEHAPAIWGPPREDCHV